MEGEDDALVMVKPLLELAGAWRQFLRGDMSNAEYELLQRHDWKTIWIEFWLLRKVAGQRKDRKTRMVSAY